MITCNFLLYRLALTPIRVLRGDHDGSEAWIEHRKGSDWRTVEDGTTCHNARLGPGFH